MDVVPFTLAIEPHFNNEIMVLIPKQPAELILMLRVYVSLIEARHEKVQGYDSQEKSHAT